jgi:charged multivesicular body protein 1
MEDELINLKLTSKQMVMASKKCEKNHKKQLKDVEKAIKQGNREGAQIYAQNSIREKTQGMNYLRLSSRIDAVAARLETAIRTKQVTVFDCTQCVFRIIVVNSRWLQISSSMNGVVQSMGNALKSMDPVKVRPLLTMTMIPHRDEARPTQRPPP